MRAVIQRVKKGRVIVEGRCVAEINKGLVILLGIAPSDDAAIAQKLAEKIAYLRIFNDPEDKMNLSVRDIHGEAIVVSQFTLFADTSRGRRPSFIGAAKPEHADPLVGVFAQLLKKMGCPLRPASLGHTWKSI